MIVPVPAAMLTEAVPPTVGCPVPDAQSGQVAGRDARDRGEREGQLVDGLRRGRVVREPEAEERLPGLGGRPWTIGDLPRGVAREKNGRVRSVVAFVGAEPRTVPAARATFTVPRATVRVSPLARLATSPISRQFRTVLAVTTNGVEKVDRPGTRGDAHGGRAAHLAVAVEEVQVAEITSHDAVHRGELEGDLVDGRVGERFAVQLEAEEVDPGLDETAVELVADLSRAVLAEEQV